MLQTTPPHIKSITRYMENADRTVSEWYDEIHTAFDSFKSSYLLSEKTTNEKLISDFSIFSGSKLDSLFIGSTIESITEFNRLFDVESNMKKNPHIDESLILNFCNELQKFHVLVFNSKTALSCCGTDVVSTDSAVDYLVVTKHLENLKDVQSNIRSIFLKFLYCISVNLVSDVNS